MPGRGLGISLLNHREVFPEIRRPGAGDPMARAGSSLGCGHGNCAVRHPLRFQEPRFLDDVRPLSLRRFERHYGWTRTIDFQTQARLSIERFDLFHRFGRVKNILPGELQPPDLRSTIFFA